MMGIRERFFAPFANFNAYNLRIGTIGLLNQVRPKKGKKV